MKNVSEIMFRWCLTYDAVYRILMVQRPSVHNAEMIFSKSAWPIKAMSFLYHIFSRFCMFCSFGPLVLWFKLPQNQQLARLEQLVVFLSLWFDNIVGLIP